MFHFGLFRLNQLICRDGTQISLKMKVLSVFSRVCGSVLERNYLLAHIINVTSLPRFFMETEVKTVAARL